MAVKRLLPTRNGDGDTAQTPTRTDPYLGAYTLNLGGGNWGFADEGSYFVMTNATLATGIAGHAAPVVADTDTKALLHVYNGTVYNLVPDYLFLEVTAAGTAGTIHYTTIYIDNKGATARSSGGTQITAFNSTRSAGAGNSTSGLVAYFGAVVTAMTSSVKVGQQIVREVIPVVQDTVTMKFGGPNGSAHSALTTAGTATNHAVQHFAPLAVGPGGNLNISQIRPSQSAAASYQFEFGFWLR
jgi:hypothetical protein